MAHVCVCVVLGAQGSNGLNFPPFPGLFCDSCKAELDRRTEEVLLPPESEFKAQAGERAEPMAAGGGRLVAQSSWLVASGRASPGKRVGGLSARVSDPTNTSPILVRTVFSIF